MDQEYFLPIVASEPVRTLAPVNWGIAQTYGQLLRDAGGDGTGEVIGVCDTGGDPSHPILKDQYHADPFSFVPNESWFDGNSHGRHCQGTAFGSNPDLAWAVKAKGLSGKCLSNGGSGLDSWIMAAIERCAKLGATIISLSIGGGGYNPNFDALGRELTQQGINIIIASGNEREQGGRTTYPARYPWAIRVAAIRSDGRYASFSNPGQDSQTISIGFAGQDIASAGPNGSYQSKSGTSMATPGYSSFVACVQSLRVKRGWKRYTTPELIAMQDKLATDVGTPGRDVDYGPGLADARLWLNALTADPPPLAV